MTTLMIHLVNDLKVRTKVSVDSPCVEPSGQKGIHRLRAWLQKRFTALNGCTFISGIM